MKIFLIGLPGCGKSTLGKELAVALNTTFIDLDAAIEKSEGKLIHAIFKESGEDYFRDRETDELKKIIREDGSFVMATGGGTPCFNNNITLINQSGQSIFLDVPVREIVRRIKKTDRGERPLLGRIHPDELKSQIETLRTHRLVFYAKASVTLASEKITTKELLQKIIVRKESRQSP